MTRKGFSIFRFIVSVIFIFYATGVYALPENWQVQEGSADFQQPDQDTLNITTSDRVIIDYNSFSIAQQEAVNFYQPSSASVALNRVTGVNPSEILGALTSTGRIFLVNPNGVFFGSNSRVDTVGLVASTLNINNSDFLSGNYTFSKHVDKIGTSVINKGYIQSKELALLGSSVKNEGLIVSTLGSCLLAAGERMSLSLDTAGMISVVIDEVVKDEIIVDGTKVTSGVENAGTIEANGGVVVLTAKALDNVFDYAVNTNGIIEANTLDTTNGRVELRANQRANVAGTINAEGGKVIVDSQGGNFTPTINATETIINTNDRDQWLSGVYGTDLLCLDNENIFVDGDLTVTGDFTVRADNDDSGSGYFMQNSGTTISVSDDVDITAADVYLDEVSLVNSFYAKAKRGEIKVGWYDDEKSVAVEHGRIICQSPIGSISLISQGDGVSKNDISLGMLIAGSNVILDSRQGGIIDRNGSFNNVSAVINLIASALNGIGSSDALETVVANFSASNTGSGNIIIDNVGIGDLTIYNPGPSFTFEGVSNDAVGGLIDIRNAGPMHVMAPISGRGNITLTAAVPTTMPMNSDILQSADITISQTVDLMNTPIVNSSSHPLDAWTPGVSNDPTVDVEWTLQELTGTIYEFVATAGGAYTQAIGSTIRTNGGDATINANADVTLSLIDAFGGDVSITGTSIIDGDSGTAYSGGDYDIKARTVTLSPIPSLDYGQDPLIDPSSLDIGYPGSGFAYSWTHGANGNLAVGAYDTLFSGGNWTFSTTSPILADAQDWYFNVATSPYPNQIPPLASPTASCGAFWIDTTSPTITASRDVLPNAYGWNNQTVTVSYTVADALSGPEASGGILGSSYDPDVFATEGVGQSGYGIVYDLAGNWADVTETPINIDLTAPTITASRDVLPNAYGWNNQTVTVSYTVADLLSGPEASGGILGSSYDPDVFATTTEGAGQSGYGIVYDLAGNSANVTETPINIDVTGPIITAVADIVPNAYGWNNQTVTVSYTVADALSGPEASGGILGSSYDPDVFATEGAGQSGSGIVYDLAGNWAFVPLGPINIDLTSPTITASRDVLPNAYGWNNQTVTVDYTVGDLLSGTEGSSSIVGSSYFGSSYDPDVFATEGVGQSGYGIVYDLAGNSANVTETPINIDLTAPVVTYTPAISTYGTDITVDFSATDSLSGFAPNGALSAPDFDSYTTSAEGIYTFTSQVIFDLAGNSSQGTAGAYRISYPVQTDDYNDRWRWPVQELLGPLGAFRPYPMDPLVAPVPAYFYHPVTLTDSSAFDGLQLTEDMYDFIEGQIQMRGAPFFGWFEEAFKKKNPQTE